MHLIETNGHIRPMHLLDKVCGPMVGTSNTIAMLNNHIGLETVSFGEQSQDIVPFQVSKQCKDAKVMSVVSEDSISLSMITFEAPLTLNLGWCLYSST